MPTDPARKKIVYVIGLGRSGTTLTDILLGNALDASSAGELAVYPARHGVRRNTDESSERYLFWQAFRDRLISRNARYADYDWLHSLHRRYEYHSGFLMDKALLHSDSRRKAEYYEYLNVFFSELFAACGSSIVVDSSKYPGRAFHLARALPAEQYELCYVYVTKHPVAVVRSYGRKGLEQSSRSWLGANLRYALINRLCSAVAQQLSSKYPVVHLVLEDLLYDPVSCLNLMQSRLGLDMSAALERLANDEPLKVGNLFDGNRIRHQEVLKLEPPKEIKIKTFGDRLTWLLNRRLYRA